MEIKDFFRLSDGQLKHYAKLDEKYRLMRKDPEHCEPMFIIDTPAVLPPWEERLADPEVMMKAELEQLRGHLELEDDRAMTVRVQFGTAQIAAAFGCELFVPPNSLPAARSHILKNAEDIYEMPLPSLSAGWYGKVEQFSEFYRRNLHEGVHMQRPDVQSPFNTAHLIRGNDILLDFYDNPDALCALLDKVTDYMIALIPHLNAMTGRQDGWFYDWGVLWKGAARISNCSMHMISPAMYEEYVLPRDIRLMQEIGGGRIHYCGTSGDVIDCFFKNENITGLDYDLQYHDLWSLCERAPKNTMLMVNQWGCGAQERENMERLLERLERDGWPDKRNIIIHAEAASREEGKTLLRRLRATVKG